MDDTEHRSFEAADENREFPHGRAEILNVGGGQVGRLTFEPGWRWSSDVQPIAGTASCEAPHFQYQVSGRLTIRMDDGAEFTAGPEDITSRWSPSIGSAQATTPASQAGRLQQPGHSRPAIQRRPMMARKMIDCRKVPSETSAQVGRVAVRLAISMVATVFRL